MAYLSNLIKSIYLIVQIKGKFKVMGLKTTPHLDRRIKAGLAALLLAMFQISGAQEYDFEQNPDGLVVMEAENYTENVANGMTEWLFTQEPVDYSGEGAMMAVTDASFASAEEALAGSAILVYRINFKESGPHYVWARTSRSADNPGGTDSYHAGLDVTIPESGTFINFEEAFGEEGDGIWKWIWWCNPIGGQAYVDVPSAGVHEFVVYIRENNFRIDKVVLSPVDYQDGLGYGPPEDNIPETIPATGIFSAEPDPGVLTFFPNPAGDRIKVRIRDGAAAINQIGLYDITGKMVRSVQADFLSHADMEVGDLATGVYYLKLKRGEETVSVKKMLKL